VLVVVATKVEPLTAAPYREDRPQGSDHLLHPGHRPLEIRAETLLDLCPHLRAEAERESSFGQQLQVVGLMRKVNRIAREGDCDVCHQVQPTDRRRQS
jgi:hypothetical protein